MLTDDIKKLQISLYEGLKSHNRLWLKQEIKRLLSEKTEEKDEK